MDSRLSEIEIRMLRMRSQRLFGPTVESQAGSEQLLSALVGVQAQDPPAALLSLGVRSDILTAVQIEAARQQGSIVRIWAMRGTLHLLTREDAAWLIPFLGPVFAPANLRRFNQLGWDADRESKAIQLIRSALSSQGPLTREEIVHILKSNGLPSEGQAPIHLIYQAALRAVLVQGPDRDGQSTFTLFADWVGKTDPRPRDAALAELAHRYLRAYAPASPQDFASWSGLSQKTAREAWASIASQIVSFETGREPLWILKFQAAWLDELPRNPRVVRLLPRFDIYSLGYANRDLVVDPGFAKRVNAGGGIIHPILLFNGRTVGTWKTNRRPHSIELVIEPFEPLDPELSPALESEAARLSRILGIPAAVKII